MLLTSVRLHAIAPRHIRVSSFPIGARCKATPLISTSASSCGSKRSKEQGVRHKCRSLFLWLAPCRALRSVPIMGTEIVTAHSVRLFRPRFARPYDSPLVRFHHLPKDPIVRVFFSLFNISLSFRMYSISAIVSLRFLNNYF